MELITFNDSVDGLSTVTQYMYKTKMDKLCTLAQKNYVWILKHPKTVIELIKTNISTQSATIAAYLTPICKLYTLNPNVMKTNQHHYNLYKGYLKFYNEKRVEIYEKNALTQSQSNNLITMQELRTKVSDLHDIWNDFKNNNNTNKNLKTNLQYLLFNVFIYTKPKRADLGNVLIVDRSAENKNTILKGNYIVASSDNSDNGWELVLNEYKTSKVYGTLRETLDPKLARVIKQSITLYKRDHLFVQTSGSDAMKPMKKNNSYGRFVRRAFEQHFNKSMGVSLWRHVYIGENVDFNKTSMADLKKDARLSGHSVGMQLLVYRPVTTND